VVNLLIYLRWRHRGESHVLDVRSRSVEEEESQPLLTRHRLYFAAVAPFRPAAPLAVLVIAAGTALLAIYQLLRLKGLLP
jgi:hypothetical protein